MPPARGLRSQEVPNLLTDPIVVGLHCLYPAYPAPSQQMLRLERAESYEKLGSRAPGYLAEQCHVDGTSGDGHHREQGALRIIEPCDALRDQVPKGDVVAA